MTVSIRGCWTLAWHVVHVLLWVRCCMWNSLASIRWKMLPGACAWDVLPAPQQCWEHWKEGDTGPQAPNEMCGFRLSKPKSSSSELDGFRWQLCGGCGNLFPSVQLMHKQYINTVYIFKCSSTFKCWVGRGNCSYKGLSEQMCWPGKDAVWSSWRGTKLLLNEDLISLTSERAHSSDRSVG